MLKKRKEPKTAKVISTLRPEREGSKWEWGIGGWKKKYTLFGTNNTPCFITKFFITKSQSCSSVTYQYHVQVYGILGKMFKLKLKLLCPYYYPTNHTQAGVTSARPCIYLRI